MKRRRPAHHPLLVWMAREPDPVHGLALEMSINALTHLLAGTVAVDLDSPPGGNRVAILTLDQGASQQQVDRWDGVKFVKVASSFKVPFTADELRDLVPMPPKGRPWRGLVFVVNLDDPLGLPQYLKGDERLDQAVYLTDRLLRSVSDALKLGLDKWARQAFYNGVVCTLLREPRHESAVERFVQGIRGLSPWDTRDEPDPSHTSHRDRDGEAARLFRDACNLMLDAARLGAAWKDYDRTGRPRALHYGLEPPDQERVSRWGRAVTNRRAGVAISGGGASAYRTVPLLKKLEAPDDAHTLRVPVDVIAGLSGGALIAAYFAARGLEGLDSVGFRGPFFQVAMPIAAVMTWPLQFVVDLDLDFTRVEELDVRYAALTTMHRRKGGPEAGVVVDATIGEAVRASGTLPPMFATTDKLGTHYTDGGGSALVPSIAARDCGADITLSVNVLSGPDRSNMLDSMWFGIGNFLYDYTPVSRLVDFFVWYTFQWRRASRRFGVLADEYLEYTPQQVPMVESVLFMCARRIEHKGEQDQRVAPAIDRFRRLYERLQRF